MARCGLRPHVGVHASSDHRSSRGAAELRHSDASTTLGHYGHVLGNDQREAIASDRNSTLRTNYRQLGLASALSRNALPLLARTDPARRGRRQRPFSRGVSNAVFFSHLAQVLARLTLLVGVEARLNKLMVGDGEQKVVEANRNTILRLEHFLG